jgi:hypothetical protein
MGEKGREKDRERERERERERSEKRVMISEMVFSPCARARARAK